MSIICDTPSIRDVIAFPKTFDGKDPMSGAPVEVPQSALDLYHVQVKNTDSVNDNVLPRTRERKHKQNLQQ